MNDLINDLIRDEGLELKPYVDTVGKTTIGVGRNLTDRGISKDEAMVLLNNDVQIASRELTEAAGDTFFALHDNAQRGLLNMAFNMGVPRLMGFKKMWAALEEGDYQTAAIEALDSRWAVQVGARATRIAALIRQGESD